MEEQGERKRRERRAFTDQYKSDVVALCRTSGKSIGQVCRDMGLSETAVRRWIAQAEVDRGKREGLTTGERQELTELRKENRALREERDLLKRAAAFFAREVR
jgi:transposase